MKKGLSLFVVMALLMSSFSFTAVADENDLPFAVEAPTSVYATWLEGDDAPTTVNLTYSLSNEMTEFFKKFDDATLTDSTEDFLRDYGLSDISISTQIDWAIDDVEDSVSGWHSNNYWEIEQSDGNGFGYDSDGNYRVSSWDVVDGPVDNCTETVNSIWVLRGIGEEEFNGYPDSNTPGIKDQLNEDQYTFDGENLSIDFTEHTAYFRARIVVRTVELTDDEEVEKYYYSDWSDTAACGKDAEEKILLTEDDIEAPVITGLRISGEDGDGNPMAAFTLTVPDEIANYATSVTNEGGSFFIETEARVKDTSEWILMINTERDVKAGELECCLSDLAQEDEVITKDTEIELRCRYYCEQSGEEAFYSDYSDVITFDTDEISKDSGKLTEDKVKEEPHKKEHKEKDSCPVCHFCPHPLGLCIFIWLVILVAVIAFIVVIVKVSRKNKK